MNIVVFSTYDVWPIRDGGQSRYFNLWTNMSRHHQITIICYDFRQESSEKTYWLSSNVRIIVPQASPSDISKFQTAMNKSGLWLQDLLCINEYELSQQFVETSRAALREADIVVASHPYLSLFAFSFCNSAALKIYEAHNVEFDVKLRYLKSSNPRFDQSKYVESVWNAERFACETCDLITVVTSDDADRLEYLYDFDRTKLIIVPNGVDTTGYYNISQIEKDEILNRLVPNCRPVLCFIGSSYSANVEAYIATRDKLAAVGFDGCVVLIGSIAEINRGHWTTVNFNEVFLGFVSQKVKACVLGAADAAIHLMTSGGGSNLKLFEYMAAGIPIIGNSFGCRGVAGKDWYMSAESKEELHQAIFDLQDFEKKSIFSKNALEIVRLNFDWAKIAKDFEEHFSMSNISTEM